MLSPQEKKDKVIRSTDIDALSCRSSANRLSYFVPPDSYTDVLIQSYQKYLQYCQGYTGLSSGRTLRQSFGDKKFPLINRGTYFRTRAIDVVIEQFIKEFPQSQIVSLGGGSDTRAYRILNKHQLVNYYEIDFPESVKIKKLAILQSDEIKKIIDFKEKLSVNINNREEFDLMDGNIHTSKYHLIAYDLRDLKDDPTQFNQKLEGFDVNLPTLVLSECVLCYMNPAENTNVLKFWKDFCKEYVSVFIYEPMSLHDAFGTTMAKNLADRGINLLTFNEYSDLQEKSKYLHETCGFQRVRLTDLSEIAGYGIKKNNHKESWVDVQEIYRINHIELIDEVEEIRLLLQHYCLCYAEYSESNKKLVGIDRWNWLESVE
ncbi:carboxy methyl transferase for protein phosphatase 2A [Scheffersomyces coipomensis]|uniref:carboxy methyl transferase for protein phosphatase 2A n=1 Tax=Scheffersomyces coipomensis TaxID=1788519 RepID=UPI00315CF42E